MKTWIIVGALLAPAAAHADQCQLLDAATAARVKAIVAQPHRFAELCEPCGEKVPGVPFSPHTIELGDELMLDGKSRDLAYTYVETDASRFENLAVLAGCQVAGVSPTLSVETETPDGVMITASNEPVMMRVPAAPELVAELPPPPAGATYYTTNIMYTVPWAAIAAIAGCGGFLLGVVAGILLLGSRRRRDMEPRAANLT